jgi:cobalamin biosynthesis protein CobT
MIKTSSSSYFCYSRCTFEHHNLLLKISDQKLTVHVCAEGGAAYEVVENEAGENEDAENEDAENEGAQNEGAENEDAENGAAENEGAENEDAESEGAENEGAENEGAEGPAPSDNRRIQLVITVEIEEGKSERIEMWEGDSPRQLAMQFCEEHGLDESVVEPLTEHILDNVAQLQ